MSLLDDDNLPHECSILRQTREKKGLAASKQSLTSEQTEVKCWEQQASATEIREFEKRGISVTRKVYFNSDPSVTEQHFIRITKRNGSTVSNPIDLEVKHEAIPDASAGLGLAYKVMVNHLTGTED